MATSGVEKSSKKKTEKKLAAREEAKLLAGFMGVMNNMRKQVPPPWEEGRVLARWEAAWAQGGWRHGAPSVLLCGGPAAVGVSHPQAHPRIPIAREVSCRAAPGEEDSTPTHAHTPHPCDVAQVGLVESRCSRVDLG